MEKYSMDPRTTQIVLLEVFKYLDTFDLLKVSQVSSQWRDIASRPIYWRTVTLKNCTIVNVEGMAKKIKKKKTQTLILEKINLKYKQRDKIDAFWSKLLYLLQTAKTLTRFSLGFVPSSVLDWVHCGRLGENLLYLSMEIEGGRGPLDLSNITRFKKLEELDLTFDEVNVLKNTASLGQMTSLKYLTLKTRSMYFDDPRSKIFAHIQHLPQLLLPRLPNLKKLTLDDGGNTWESRFVFRTFGSHPSLEELVLINMSVGRDFRKELALCTNLKKLYIEPSGWSEDNVYQLIVEGLYYLRNTLKSFKLGVFQNLLSEVNDFKFEPAISKLKFIGSEVDNVIFFPFITPCDCESLPCTYTYHVTYMSMDVFKEHIATRYPKLETSIVYIEEEIDDDE